MMRRLANLLCVTELALFIIVPLVAWVASVLGANIVNLVSEEALRWFFYHAADILSSAHLSLLILALTAVGAMQESGFVSQLYLLFTNKDRLQHRKAIFGSIAFLLIVILVLMLPVMFNFTALLSVSGTLFPSSPWLSGFPLALCAGTIATSLLYATFSSQIVGVASITNLLTQGFSRYGIWIVDVMMGGMIYHIVKYCFSTPV